MITSSLGRMIFQPVNRQAQHLGISFSPFGRKMGDRTKLRCADGDKIFRMAEQDAPGSPDP